MKQPRIIRHLALAFQGYQLLPNRLTHQRSGAMFAIGASIGGGFALLAFFAIGGWPAVALCALLLGAGSLLVVGAEPVLQVPVEWPEVNKSNETIGLQLSSASAASVAAAISISKVTIPHNIVSKLAKERHPDGLSEDSQLMYAVCLATDAGNYTTLAEAIDPMTLGQVMNEYYSAIFEPIRRQGGIVSDVMGDAMLAIWATPQADETTRIQACDAALELLSAVDGFNQSHTLRLPTRIGLHYGQMRLRNVGSSDHYEYRAVGDVVNSATRIEGLNKQLGTRILVSEDALSKTAKFYTRKLGTFLLEGKSRSLVIHELLCREDEIKPEQQRLYTLFSEALKLFYAQNWDEALKKFSLMVVDYPNDGPSLFYLRRCRMYKEYPPDTTLAPVISIERNETLAI